MKNLDTGQTFNKCEDCDRPPEFLYWEAPKCARHWKTSFVIPPENFPHLEDAVRRANKLIEEEESCTST